MSAYDTLIAREAFLSEVLLPNQDLGIICCTYKVGMTVARQVDVDSALPYIPVACFWKVNVVLPGIRIASFIVSLKVTMLVTENVVEVSISIKVLESPASHTGLLCEKDWTTELWVIVTRN
jgi:hypothetical protein